MTDLSSVFPVIIFLSLVVILTGFFVVDVNNDISLVDWEEGELNIYQNYVNESGLVEDNEVEYDLGEFVISVLAVTGGIVATALGHPYIGITLIAYGVGSGIMNTPQGNSFVSSLPIIGPLVDGLSYVGTAISSFWGVLSWSPDLLGGFPVFGILIIVPITLFFFIFVIRFIRGQ